MRKEAIKTLVPSQVYTDRQEHIDYFYKQALNTPTRRAMSTVLLGQRRMGKTEIFKRVVNRLFFEQDHTDPNAVVPVYYSFEDNPPNRWDFATEYLENFIRWYVAFRLRDLKVLSKTDVPSNNLIAFIKTNSPPLAKRFKGLFRTLEGFAEKTIVMPEKVAVQLPRDVSDWDDSSIVMFLDEFQNTRLNGFHIVGFMQNAVESPTCPHFVTGSAMSILAREIIGRGALFGRFRSKVIEPLSSYYGTQLAIKAAKHYGAKLSTLMAPIVADRCGSNPFYITAVMWQAVEQNQTIVDEKILNQILAVDISSGFIWGELSDQVNRWIARINNQHITKWILYLSAIEKEDRLDIDHIQKTLHEKEGKLVPVETIREVLVKLSRGDLIDYLELGGWFRKIKDPILNDFLKIWGRIEVEGHPYGQVQTELRGEYLTLQRRINEYKGYLAEVFMAQVLWAGQDKTHPGHFFNSQKDVWIPWHFAFIQHRMHLGEGKGQEIDLLAAAGEDIWVCESKWWTTKKVDVDVLEKLLKQGETAKPILKASRATAWIFAYSGLTKEAETYAKEHGILWSTYTQLNELLSYLKLRQLPKL